MFGISTRSLALGIIYLNVVLYSLCYQLQRPLEPFLVDKLTSNDSQSEYAKLQSFFSILQTVGSLVSGYLLGRSSVRWGFLLSYASSALSYWLLSQARSIDMLYFSKIPSLFQAGFLCAQLAVSIIWEKEENSNDDNEDDVNKNRAISLGRLTMSYTVGMVIGPLVGGLLGQRGDYYYGATLATYGSILSLLLTLLIPNIENNSNKNKQKNDKNETETTLQNGNIIDNGNIIKSVVSVLSLVWLLLETKIISGFAISICSTALPLILKNNYSFKEGDMGMYMSLSSASTAIINGFVLGPILSFFRGNLKKSISFFLFSMSVLYIIQSIVAFRPLASKVILLTSFDINHVYVFILLSLLLTVFQYVLSTTITSLSTSLVSNNEKGTLLGMEHSLFAAARVISPHVGIELFTSGGVSALYGASGFIFLITLIVWKLFQSTIKLNSHETKILSGKRNEDSKEGKKA